jgi:hypothetical protein
MKNILSILIKCYVWGLSFGKQIDAFGQVCHADKQKISLIFLGKVKCLIL